MKKTAAVLLTLVFIFISLTFSVAGVEGSDTDIVDGTAETEDTATESNEDGEESETEQHQHELVFVEEVPPACTQPGALSHYVCGACGKLFFDEEGLDEIEDEKALLTAPAGHNWGEWETVLEPGTVTPGVERRICNNQPAEDVVLTVTLDAGHGMYDNKGAIEGFYEGRMSFALMSYLKAELEKYSGVVVYTTRQKLEDAPELPLRGKMAAENGSDLFISLHSNWFTNNTACGVSVYRSYFRPESEELGSRLGLAVTKVINDITEITYMRNDGHTMTRIEDAFDETCGDGVTQDYYNVTRESVKSEKCRYSYIIEHGFHSNPVECYFLMQDENLKKLAYAESRVIAVYFGLHKREGDLNGRHAEYREIPPTGSDDFPYVYEIPESFTADVSAALPGGATVKITELEEADLDSAASYVSDKRIIYAFDFDTALLLWDIKPDGDIKVCAPFPECGDGDNIGAVFINGTAAERLPVYEDTDTAEISVYAKKAGTYVIFAYNATEVTAYDVNGDGGADNKDVVTLFRYVSGEGVFVEKLTVDINGDDEVSNRDVVLLFRALSGADITAE